MSINRRGLCDKNPVAFTGAQRIVPLSMRLSPYNFYPRRITGFSVARPSRRMVYNRRMDTLFHICDRADWREAQGSGEYRAASLDGEGFIHCSTAGQAAATADRFYRGRRGLVLLVIDPARVRPPVRYEAAGGSLFPHVYGPLNLDAVVDVRGFEPGEDGTFPPPA